jgi:hypothetical protein
MKKLQLLENFKYLIYFIIGFLLISFVVYFRILYKRLPKILWFYESIGEFLYWNIPIVVFVFLMLIFSCLMIFLSIRGITETTIIIKPNKLVLFFIHLTDMVKKSLYVVYSFITNKIPDGFNKVGKLIMLFFNSKLSKFEYILFIKLFIRSLICIFFIYDVFVCFKLEFFYKGLILLIINIIIDIWMFTIKDWSTTNIQAAKNLLDVESFNVGLPDEYHNIKFSKKYENLNLDLNYHIEIYRNLGTMCDFSEAYDCTKRYYTQRFNLIYYTIILLSCGYIILKNLNKII